MRKLFLTLCLALLPLTSTAEVAVPALSARVTDLAGVLQPEQHASLESRLATLEQEKAGQEQTRGRQHIIPGAAQRKEPDTPDAQRQPKHQKDDGRNDQQRTGSIGFHVLLRQGQRARNHNA